MTKSSVGPGPDDDSGTSAPTYDFDNDGPAVGSIRLAAPPVTDFIVRATLPVPPGTWSDRQPQMPLGIITSSDPTLAVTQVNTVTRYPDPTDGADVVEVMARVRRPDVPVGTMIDYQVVYCPHSPTEFEHSPAVEGLLEAPGSVRLISNDPFGHRYESDLLAPLRDDAEGVQVMREGPLCKEWKLPSALVPVSPESGNQGTLPRLMGVNAYVRTYANEDYIALDLHVHNGFDGQDPSVDWDEVLDDLYFRQLKIRIPNGWTVLHGTDSPYAGDTNSAGNMQECALITPLSGGKMHLMPKQSQFVRRIMLTRINAAERAAAELNHQTIAFCQMGEGEERYTQWSWWNPETARYLPQNHQIADLSGITSPEAMDAQFTVELETLAEQVRTGAAGGYPTESAALGYAQPYGVAYGGMTGGDQIIQNPGTDVAWSASQAGYALTLLRARMQLDRQPQALVNKNGVPTPYDDFIFPTGLNGPWTRLHVVMNPKDDNIFDYENAPSFQADHVAAQNLKPDYEGALKHYKPNDLQHLIRYTADLYTAIWLGNDSLAKQQMLQTGELFRMTHQDLPVGNYGWVAPQSMRKFREVVDDHPGTGVGHGRGEGWGMFASIGAYAIGDDALRDRYRPWLADFADIIARGQSACTGNITARYINKNEMTDFRTRQAFEVAFVVNALESMRTSVFAGVDTEMEDMLGQVIVACARSTQSFPFWDPAWGGHRKILAVGRSDFSTPDFCTQLPANANYGFNTIDNNTCLNGWAYAYRITGDESFLTFASSNLGVTGNLENELELQGLPNLKHYVMLLGTVQTIPPQH